MPTVRTPAQEAAEDIFFGQIVIIWARWFFILAGAILALWSSATISELTLAVVFIVALMGINFLVHGRYLLEKPANRLLILVTALLDLVVITLLVLTWRGQGGLQSQFFIFYYPLLLAFALVFPPKATLSFTALTLGAYSLACFTSDPAFFVAEGALKLFAMRVITLAATGGLGTYYWRVQRSQRRALANRPSPLPRVMDAPAVSAQG
jgi:hypothetical protein